jgi:hypothetical protein
VSKNSITKTVTQLQTMQINGAKISTDPPFYSNFFFGKPMDFLLFIFGHPVIPYRIEQTLLIFVHKAASSA